MSYILFLVYLFLYCWLLTKIRFVKNAGLGTRVVVGLFLVKLSAGLIYGWLMHRATYLADTWDYHNESMVEYHLLFSNPKEYFLDFFQSNYGSHYGGFFDSYRSYWNDLRSNLVIKLLSVFDIFSFGNYYINVIFYNFIIFFGNLGLFRVFAHIYKDKKWQLVVACFLLPSLLFFGSGIHKDGLILGLLGIIIFNIYYSLNYSGFTFRRIIYITLALCFIFLLRNFIFIAIIPAIVAWLIAHNKRHASIVIFLVTYLISAIVFFNIGEISSRLSLPEKVVQRQIDFNGLEKAATDIPLNPLKPTFKSFIASAPQSFNHSLMRPYISDISLAKFLLPFSVEIFFYELIFVLFLFFHIKYKDRSIPNDPFILFGVFFSLSVFLMVGYTIPILGSIIRYRSIYLPFILAPVFCNIPWQLLRNSIQIKK